LCFNGAGSGADASTSSLEFGAALHNPELGYLLGYAPRAP